MGNPTRLTRRLVPALAIAVVAGLLATTVAAIAGGDSAQAQADPRTVDVPMPRLGDAGLYTATLEGDWPLGVAVDEPFDALRFEWQQGRPVRDSESRLVETDALLTSTRYFSQVKEGGQVSTVWSESNDTLLYRQGTSIPVVRP